MGSKLPENAEIVFCLGVVAVVALVMGQTDLAHDICIGILGYMGRGLARPTQ